MKLKEVFKDKIFWFGFIFGIIIYHFVRYDIILIMRLLK